MAYVATDLAQVDVVTSAGQEVKIFAYVSTVDSVGLIVAADYFGDVDDPNERLGDGDLVYVQGNAGVPVIGRYDAATRSLATALTFA